MYKIDSGHFTLTGHPQSSSQAIREIYVKVEETMSGSLMLTFCLVGDISGVRIPEPRSPRRADNLWQHTCFEVDYAGLGARFRAGLRLAFG